MALITRTIEGWGIHVLLEDPNTANGGAGEPGDRGDVLVRTDVPLIYQNVDGTPTNWRLGVDPTAFPDYTEDGTLKVPTFLVGVNHPGGAVEAAFSALPARTNGWRLVDAYLRSRGGSAGSLTLLDASGGNAMTDAMLPAALNGITRASEIIRAEEDVPGGAIPVWSGAAGTPPTTCYALFVGL